MHMADALVSPPVAAAAAVASAVLIGVATTKIKRRNDNSLLPLMGVMGAFVFAAQMINFSIPGTGSSGHIIGGVMLAAVMGPWAALLTLTSVLVIQCLVFADGGLMALGCNILNMGVMTTLVAYPLIFRPITRRWKGYGALFTASLLACVVGLEGGAILVTIETELSGITALSWGSFFGFMTGIHLFIGLGEGLATAALLTYLKKQSPELLDNPRLVPESVTPATRKRSLKPLWIVAGAAVVLAVTFTWIASSNPDGLEWSVQQMTGATEVINNTAQATRSGFASAQNTLSFLPDYDSTWSGIIGCALVVTLVWALTTLIFRPAKAHRHA